MANRLNCFPLKQLALQYIENNNIKHQYLFSRDISEDGKQEFYVQSYEEIYNIVNNVKEAHLYEYFNDTDPARLFLDIDYKKDNKVKFSSILNEIIQLIDNTLEEHNRFNQAKIILKSCSNKKHSAHIIYPNVIFENIKQMKKFILDINSPLVENKIIDTAIYKTGCFRLYKSSKMKYKIPLIYYKSINYKFIDDKTIFYDTLVRNISHIPKKDYIKIKLEIPEKNTLKMVQYTNESHKIIDNDEIIDIDILADYVFIINEQYGEKYKDWIKVGMALYNCNQSEECFNLWCDWSKQFAGFSSVNDCKYKWGKFKRHQYGFAIGTIKYYARKSNSKKYLKIEQKYRCDYNEYMF